MVEQAPFAVIEHGNDLRITRWNRGAERIFGYTLENALGRFLTDLILQEKDSDAWRQQAQEGTGAPSIWEGVRKDGSVVSCEWVHHALRDDVGTAVGAVCFGRDVTAEVQQAALHEQTARLLRVALDNLPLTMWVIDPRGIFTVHEGTDPAAIGVAPHELVGTSIFELYPDMTPWIRQALAGERTYWSVESHGAHMENWTVPFRDQQGDVTSVVGITLDISKSKHIEQYLRTQLDVIKRQQRVIRDMSTSIIQVWDKVLALPMVSVVDSARTAEVTSSLLDAVVRTHARFVILDLTGVDDVDPKTAAFLIDLVRAIRLLGAEAIVTGIRPSVAQAVIALGVDLGGIVTLANLRAALHRCIAQMNREASTA